MSTRSLVPAVLFCLLVGALLLPACSWEPLARNVQPERLLEGPARVTRLLDGEGRYALVDVGRDDALRRHIVNVETRQSCILAQTDEPVGKPLLAPNQRGANKAAFLLPILRVRVEGEDQLAELWYTDEKCGLRGPFGFAARPPDHLTLRSDAREVSLVLDKKSELRIVDPWSGAMRVVATQVGGYTPVQRIDSSTAPEAMWVISGGKLQQRALDGTLLLSLGNDVNSFQQLLSDQLRVTFRDGENVFEAKGPDFTPVLIAEDACEPEYAGRALDLLKPCAQRQLVRIDLATGEIKTFPKGVEHAYVQGEVNFELLRNASGTMEVWVSRQGLRAQLIPTPSNAISVLDSEHIAGRTGDGRFGIWSLSRPFAMGYERVQQVQTFRDARTNQLLWLILHDVDPMTNIGSLSLFDQRTLERVTANPRSEAGTPLPDSGAPKPEAGTPGTDPGNQSDAGAVPLQEGLRTFSNHVRAGAYRVLNPGTLPEYIVLSLESPITTDGNTISGTLYARFLSGSLGSLIDVGVSSSEIVVAPLPGILYGVLDGPNSGLWFAAL